MCVVLILVPPRSGGKKYRHFKCLIKGRKIFGKYGVGEEKIQSLLNIHPWKINQLYLNHWSQDSL